MEIPGQPFLYISLLEERPRHRPASYDYIYSNAVWEHIMDLPSELAWQYDLLRPGGRCSAFIGLEDHRYFDDPKTFSPWSFLLDGVYGPDQPIRPDLRINGLRSSQIRRLAEQAGFSIEKWEEEPVHEVPVDLAHKVRPEFKVLPPEDLTAFRIKAVLKKQHGSSRDSAI